MKVPTSGWADFDQEQLIVIVMNMIEDLTKQCIHGLDDECMKSEILREVSAFENTEDATSEQVLLFAQKVEAQRAQKEALDNIKEAKDFGLIR